jgi:hypothetical protein
MENPIIFEGKTFQQLLQDIYKNSAEKKVEIEKLIGDLAPLIQKASDSAIIIPVVADLLEVAVKNDEHLVKIATIVQRVIAAKTTPGAEHIEGMLTEEEKEQLYREAATHREALDDLSIVLAEQGEDDEDLERLTKKTKEAIKKAESN